MNAIVLIIVVLAAVLVIASGIWVGAALVRCLRSRGPSSAADEASESNEPASTVRPS